MTEIKTYTELDNFIIHSKAKKILLVCGSSIKLLNTYAYLNTLEIRIGIKIVSFTDFQSNPLYESIVKGVKCFRDNHCDLIAAVGGGSAIDVAKCIKLFSNMNHNQNYLKQKIVPNNVPLIAVPTTAGTGSEVTRFAVIYYNGEKQSISHESCIPSAFFLDGSVLKTLPLYQKKSTMMDAFCHAIESFWSVRSTDESMNFSKEAIQLILNNMNGYLANDDNANFNMLKAANIAGKAINITQTTAGHAMCYKLTSLYGIAHGHAAALCVEKLFSYMKKNADQCIDRRGVSHLHLIFSKIAAAMNCRNVNEAAACFSKIISKLELKAPDIFSEKDIEMLKNSVNTTRLKNNPVPLSIDAVETLYKEILHI